jgi:hypothetical protein
MGLMQKCGFKIACWKQSTKIFNFFAFQLETDNLPPEKNIKVTCKKFTI